jgi:hypothetical protein
MEYAEDLIIKKNQYIRKVTEGNPKTTEELVFLTPAIRYTLESLI